MNETRQPHSHRNLLPGDPAPWFHQRSFSNPSYAFDTAAGRYIVMCFFGSAADPFAKMALSAVQAHRHLFDDNRASFFGVSIDPGDETDRRVQDSYPGLRYLWDFDREVSRLYGSVPFNWKVGDGQVPIRRFWIVLDPTLRVKAVFPLGSDAETSIVFSYLESLPPPNRFAEVELQAPVLFLPNVFEPAFCRLLMDRYQAHGGEASGFMREVNGQTVAVQDRSHKVRKDHLIEDPDVIKETQCRILRRVVPEILKSYQFHVTRMERYLVACYAAEDGGHFRAHRDNTTKGTAHRRFAVSINLNSEFEGGEVSFPEYGPRSFKPPPGGAVVFSCSLLHAVSPVTQGRRYAFLPFLYDDEAARIREANNKFLGENVGAYQNSNPAREPTLA